MAKIPLNWLLKIGGAVLKPAAKTLSEAVNILHDSTVSLGSRTTTLENNKVNKADLLTLEEISAATSLTNKGAAATAVKDLNATLTANNGTKFKFWYNTSTEEYGFKVGADTFVPFSNVGKLLTALRYSGLSIDSTSTFAEICAALAARFPNERYDKVATWTMSNSGSVNATENYISRGKDAAGNPNHVMSFSAAYGDGRTSYFETTNLNAGDYSLMRIRGSIKPSKSSTGNTPYMVFSTGNGNEIYTLNMPTYGKTYNVDFYTQASSKIKIEIKGAAYQTITGSFSVRLANDASINWVPAGSVNKLVSI